MNSSIVYTGYPTVLEGYNDANWISDSEDTKATSGYMFTLGGTAISWRSSKQTLITRPTMEAELVALELAESEAEWLKGFLFELPVIENPIPAILIYCDNQATLAKWKVRIIIQSHHDTLNWDIRFLES